MGKKDNVEFYVATTVKRENALFQAADTGFKSMGVTRIDKNIDAASPKIT